MTRARKQPPRKWKFINTMPLHEPDRCDFTKEKNAHQITIDQREQAARLMPPPPLPYKVIKPRQNARTMSQDPPSAYKVAIKLEKDDSPPADEKPKIRNSSDVPEWTTNFTVLKCDTRLGCGNVTSPTFMVGLPFGGITEMACYYPSEQSLNGDGGDRSRK
jgi:hypothetical protein